MCILHSPLQRTYLKIDKNKLGSAKHFTHVTFYYKIYLTNEPPKHLKGNTDIPADIDFNELKKNPDKPIGSRRHKNKVWTRGGNIYIKHYADLCQRLRG